MLLFYIIVLKVAVILVVNLYIFWMIGSSLFFSASSSVALMLFTRAGIIGIIMSKTVLLSNVLMAMSLRLVSDFMNCGIDGSEFNPRD